MMFLKWHGHQNNQSDLGCSDVTIKKRGRRLMVYHLQAPVPRRSGHIWERWEKPNKNDEDIRT